MQLTTKKRYTAEQAASTQQATTQQAHSWQPNTPQAPSWQASTEQRNFVMHDFGQHNFLNENMAQLSNKCDIKTMDIRQILQTLLNATQKKDTVCDYNEENILIFQT